MFRTVYGAYDTRKFSDIWTNSDDFLTDFQESELDGTEQARLIDDANVRTLFYLLYAQYGNSHLANSDENQFKYKVFSTIFMYAPAWVKRLEIQKNLRELTDTEISLGTKQIINHSFNPSTTPTTNSLDELETINDQNVNTYKRGKVDAYQILWNLIKTDVTKEFIDKFKPLFLIVAQQQRPLFYVTEIDNNEEQ